MAMKSKHFVVCLFLAGFLGGAMYWLKGESVRLLDEAGSGSEGEVGGESDPPDQGTPQSVESIRVELGDLPARKTEETGSTRGEVEADPSLQALLGLSGTLTLGDSRESALRLLGAASWAVVPADGLDILGDHPLLLVWTHDDCGRVGLYFDSVNHIAAWDVGSCQTASRIAGEWKPAQSCDSLERATVCRNTATKAGKIAPASTDG